MKNDQSCLKANEKNVTCVATGVYRQQGIALVVGLILLLVITILGMAAIRATTLQERMSANSQQQTQTFQSAEEGIRLVMAELRAQVPPPVAGDPSILITALNNAGKTPLATQKRTADTGMSGTTSTATVTFNRTTNLEGFRMGVEAGSYVAYEFIIDATAQQQSTNAVSNQQQGVARAGPRP